MVMITKNYQVWTCLLFVASIFILITIVPQSYVQGRGIKSTTNR